MYLTFTFQCFCRSLIGLILQDLALIVKVSTQRVGAVYMWIGVGGMVGSLFMGSLYSVIYPPLLLTLVCYVLSVVTIVLPWCASGSLFWLMFIVAVQAALYYGVIIGKTRNKILAEC